MIYASGYSRIDCYINGDDGVLLVHQINYRSTSTKRMLSQPSLQLSFCCRYLGDGPVATAADAACVSVSEITGFSSGSSIRTRNPRSVGNVCTDIRDNRESHMLSIRCRSVVNGVVSRVEVLPTILSVTNIKGEPMIVRLRTGATLTWPNYFTHVGSPTLATLKDTEERKYYKSGGRLVHEFIVMPEKTETIDLTVLNITVPPSLAISVMAQCVDGTVDKAHAALTWYEDV